MSYEQMIATLESAGLTPTQWSGLRLVVGHTKGQENRHGTVPAHIAWIRRKQERGEGFGPKTVLLHRLIAVIAQKQH